VFTSKLMRLPPGSLSPFASRNVELSYHCTTSDKIILGPTYPSGGAPASAKLVNPKFIPG
jgi:hypothetical protein